MQGLHLFHFTLSNCSQRVRLGLEEKGLVWTSHHLNLAANEHVTSDYQRINPKGVMNGAGAGSPYFEVRFKARVR